mgnify:CR=1 FL=1
MTASGRRRARPPIDPRLWRYSRTSRRYLVITVFMAMVSVATVIVTAAMVASILSELIVSPGLRSLDAQASHLVWLAASVVVRVAATYLHDRYAHRAGAQVIAELREAADFLRHYGALAPGLAHPARGLVAAISPWNFPLAIFLGQVSAALAADSSELWRYIAPPMPST